MLSSNWVLLLADLNLELETVFGNFVLGLETVCGESCCIKHSLCVLVLVSISFWIKAYNRLW